MENEKVKFNLGQEVALLGSIKQWAQGDRTKPAPMKIHSVYQESSRIGYQLQAGGSTYKENELVPYEEVTSQAILYLSTRLMEVAKA